MQSPMRVPPDQSCTSRDRRSRHSRYASQRSCSVTRLSRVPNTNVSTRAKLFWRANRNWSRKRAYRSIEPDTSHSSTSLVLRGLRSRNASRSGSPPVRSACRSVRRMCTRGPRFTSFQRRLGRAASRREMRRATRVTSSSSSTPKLRKSFVPSAACGLIAGMPSGSASSASSGCAQPARARFGAGAPGSPACSAASAPDSGRVRRGRGDGGAPAAGSGAAKNAAKTSSNTA